MKKHKRGFTLIELLVVIAIIGILATLAVVALQQARSRARDSKRVADMKQVHTALELFFNENGRYPTTEEWNSGEIPSLSSEGDVFMHQIPSAPTPADGNCSSDNYIYTPINNGASYTIDFCTGKTISGLAPGEKQMTPGGIVIGSGGSDGGGNQIVDGCSMSTVVGDHCGGGVVIDVVGEEMYGKRILIAAEDNQSEGVVWGCKGTAVMDNPSEDDGRFNTDQILLACSGPNAASVANEYQGGGYGGWYLPSHNELGKLIDYLKSRGLENGNYWSSTEQWQNCSSGAVVNNGEANLTWWNDKENLYKVRAVRKITIQGEMGLEPDCTPLSEAGDRCGGGIVVGKIGASRLAVLVMAENDQSTGIAWGCEGINVGSTAEDGGKLNTNRILTNCTGPSAAKIANDYRGGGYTDWFLPSNMELDFLLRESGIYNAPYWSSTEIDESSAKAVYVIDQWQSESLEHNKNTLNRVRAIRIIGRYSFVL